LHDTKKPYLAPIITALILLTGLTIWAGQDVRLLDQFHVAEMRQFADGLFHSFRSRWSDLPATEQMKPEAINRLLESLVEGSPQLEFGKVLHHNQVLAEAGNSSSIVTPEEPLGERIDSTRYLLWRPLPIPMEEPNQSNLIPPGPAQPGPGPAPPSLLGPSPTLARHRPPTRPEPLILLLGLRKERPAPVRQQVMQQLGIKFSIAFLCVLALSLAWMLGIRSRLLSSRLRLEQTRRAHLEELSLVAAGLAHETKNPLGIIRGLGQRLTRSTEFFKETQLIAGQIIDAADQATSRLGEFMSYARIRHPEPISVKLSSVLDRAGSILATDFDAASVHLEIQPAGSWILADEEMLLQVLLNLLLNSLHACNDGNSVQITTSLKGATIALLVVDDGVGIEADFLNEVFKPYVSGRSNGHGMGLPIVRRIIEQHNWTITISSFPERGTTVTVSGLQTTQPPEES
jgi:two-component system, NtrC family, sensor histidine kinase HydH